MIQRAAAALALTAALSGPAAALTCAPPDARRAFAEAQAAEAGYMVVHGWFAFDADRLPPADGSARGGVQIPARFTGFGLTRKGFSVPLEMPVTLDVGCLGPWCGSIGPEEPQLAFLERGAEGYHLALPACRQWSFPAPDNALLDRMESCLRGKCD